jgi:hypothetical protein
VQIWIRGKIVMGNIVVGRSLLSILPAEQNSMPQKTLLIIKKADLKLRLVIYNDVFVFVGFSNHCLLSHLACKMDTNSELMKSSCCGTGGG